MPLSGTSPRWQSEGFGVAVRGIFISFIGVFMFVNNYSSCFWKWRGNTAVTRPIMIASPSRAIEHQ
jgi:hypothetical protein